MNYQFLNIFLDPKELFSAAKIIANDKMLYPINSFLLDNNFVQIEKIYEFYKNDTNLLFVNGVHGTGKAEIVNYSLNFLAGDSIILKYNCFNSTVLDDILLSFFTEFKNLSAQNIISEPKSRSENFAQKINTYFSQIEKPFVVIFDSFESILEENRKEILDFIFHLTSMPKVKIIIIGRTFESKYFEGIFVERVATDALELQVFEKLLKAAKIKSTNVIIDEFYKNTQGNYFSTNLAIKVMQVQSLSIVDFLTKMRESYLPFNKYLAKQAFSLIAPADRHLFLFLCLIRHPISLQFLMKLNLANEDKIENLIKNLILFKDGDNVYIQDYLKDEIEESEFINIIHRIRQYLVELYSSQLPLKPLERNICISRQTMRKEIEFHKFFLPKKLKNSVNASMDVNYLSYSKVQDFTEKTDIKLLKENIPVKNESSGIDLTQRKNVSLDLDKLPFREKVQAVTKKEENSDEALNLKDYMVLIKRYSKMYQYSKVIELCNNSLKLKNEDDYELYLPLIYTKLAYAYQKNADYDKSLNYYELAKTFYINANDLTKVNLINFNIAKIYYETYKINQAKSLFTEIINSSSSTSLLVVKSYLQLANIEEDSSTAQNALDYYKKALEHEDEIVEPGALSELYFKYALVMDDKNDIKTAIEFYDKCIKMSSDAKVNKFLSPAYSNIAALYMEKNDLEKAVANYKRAYEIDDMSNNLEGVYYSSSKLAAILQREKSPKSLEYLNVALESAKRIKDDFYTISATLAIGDYHYDIGKNEVALKYYLKAQDLAQDKLSSDNQYKINTRINDIKFRLGVEKFENIVSIIREQEE